MPQVGSTGSYDSNNTSPGNAYNSNSGGTTQTKKKPPPPPPEPKPKDQVFECIGRGLKPNTIHKFYYENVDRTKDCRQCPENLKEALGSIGGPLKTDENGYIRFKFYFTAFVEEQVDALNKVNYNLIGDKMFELRAVDSVAKKIVPFQTSKEKVINKLFT